ncbi:MAG: glycosyltransferase [Actinomycetota bacterium]|nr:glycosyltransferase [Actinomycetota bacterium]
MIDVSVIVPTHDRSTWLCQGLRSVLRQRDVDLEVIVVDDGSTDDATRTVVKTVGDQRIVLLRHERPLGVSVARNHGAEEAGGEWLAFLDDDDLWAPRKLSRQLQAATTAGCNWAYAGCVNVDSTLRILGGRPPPRPEDVARLIFRSNIIPGGGSNVVVRRDAFQRVGPFDLRLTNTEDWEMWIRLAKQSPPAWVPEPLVAYRLHPAQSSLDVRAILDGISVIERRHGIKSARGESYRWIAASLLRTGRRTEAMRYLALATIHGQAPGAVQDVRAVLGWRLDRYLGRAPRTLQQLPHPEWTLRAEAWVNELATLAPC